VSGDRVRAAVAFTVYIAAIVAANWLTAQFGLVPVGFGFLVTAGTFAAGFALLARDFVHEYGGVRLVLVGIIIGAGISALVATPALALASALAFLTAELVDLLVFVRVRRRGFVLAVIVSNLLAAPVDTVVFLAVAGFPITVHTVVGQLIGKVVWATLVPLALWVVGRRAVSREPEHDRGA
jgi:queuosine precursor transporter